MHNIGLLGFGTVGQGFAEIFSQNSSADILIKSILVRDSKKSRACSRDKAIITTSAEEILFDPQISIIVEATGDLDMGYVWIKTAMQRGKHVVTANKAVVSKHLEELEELAHNCGVQFLYEASVAGGIPIIKNMKDLVRSNEILGLRGILNGTCNFILSQMMEESLSYEEALKLAQFKGFAEADPSSDVEGLDSLRKLRILSSIALQKKVEEEEILLEGIQYLEDQDLRLLAEEKYQVKLIGEMRRQKQNYQLIVEPVALPEQSFLAGVKDSFNMITVMASQLGELSFYGRGAGAWPTGHAILSDCLDIVERNHRPKKKNSAQLLNGNDQIQGRYYLRILEERAIPERLVEKTERVLHGKSRALITKLILRRELKELLQDLDLKCCIIRID